MKLRVLEPVLKTTAIFAAIAVSFGAVADSGPYVGVEGGLNDQADQRISRDGLPLYENGFKDGYLGGLLLGYDADGLRPELELAYRRNDFDAQSGGSGNENAYTLMGNLWLDFKKPGGHICSMYPYIGGGLGAARVDMHQPTVAGVQERGGSETLFAVQVGAGLGWALTPALTLSADYRHLQTDEGSFASNAGPVQARYRADSVMLGLRYAYGQSVATPTELVRVVPLPGDADGDGVGDASDRCPDTPPGFNVDASGCLVNQTIVLRGINFMFNSDQLTEPAQETLSLVSRALASQPALELQIVGNADSVGAEEYNEVLSQQRAKSVRRYLVGKGVNPGNLRVKSVGEANPVASNDTVEGRAENRRVEFVVVTQPEMVKFQPAEPTEQSKAAAEAGEPENLQPQ